jgi:hypothetical protein
MSVHYESDGPVAVLGLESCESCSWRAQRGS